MKIKKSTITLLIITIIAIATLLIGILDNSESSTAKNYFESTSLTIVPANSTNLLLTKTSPTLIQLQNPEELTSKAQNLNVTTIYKEGTAPTTIYSYGIIDQNNNIIYYYNNMSWFGMDTDPLYALAVAMATIILAGFLCLKYGE